MGDNDYSHCSVQYKEGGKEYEIKQTNMSKYENNKCLHHKM